MSRQVSSDFLQDLFDPETGEAILALVTIEEASLSAPIRVTSGSVRTWSADQDSDTAADLTSNDNDGTLVNGPTWTSDGPNDAIRGALSFDGVDDYVDVGNVSAFDFGASDSFTIEAWKNVQSGGGIISKGVPNSLGWILWQFTGSQDVIFEINDGANEGEVTDPGSASGWVHYAAVVDRSSDELRLYRNASLVDTDDISAVGDLTNTSKLIIGDQSNTNRPLEGEETDPRIWNVARTQQQIQDNMNTRLNGDEPGLVGYWPLDDTTSEYQPLPFEFVFPDQSDDGEVQAKLTVDNVDRRIVKAVRDARNVPNVTTEIVRGSTPDTIEAAFPDFKLRNANYNQLTVEGTLSLENLVNQPFPAHVFNPSNFPAVF